MIELEKIITLSKAVVFLVLSYGLHSCQGVKRKVSVDENTYDPIQGCWALVSYQPQDDTVFIKMEGIEIKKNNIHGEWTSTAYRTKNGQVVYSMGGSYEIKEGQLYEKIGYHLKDLSVIGKEYGYNIKFHGDSLYVSGKINEGLQDEIKIEEYWLKIY